MTAPNPAFTLDLRPWQAVPVALISDSTCPGATANADGGQLGHLQLTDLADRNVGHLSPVNEERKPCSHALESSVDARASPHPMKSFGLRMPLPTGGFWFFTQQ